MADARTRLQEISNNLFEELATDVYDEVDRRETDAGGRVTLHPLHTGISHHN